MFVIFSVNRLNFPFSLLLIINRRLINQFPKNPLAIHSDQNGCSHSGKLTVEEALRFVEHQARQCRDHDSHEALCLLPVALIRQLSLPPMDDFEAEAFKFRLKQQLSPNAAPE